MPRTRILQRLTLAFLVLLVLGIGALYYLGRSARVTAGAGDPGSPLDRGGDAQVGEGFDHTVSQEGRPLFRIRGLRDRRDREGNFHVEDVLVTVFRADGSRYEMAADRGTYRLELREARLEGAVRLEGGDGFVLEGEALELLDGGTRIESDEAVSFRYGGSTPFSGNANEFFATPEDGLYLFRNGVTLASDEGVEEPFSLTAERLAFQRQERILRAEGDAYLQWGENELKAQRVAAHMGPDRDTVQFVQARWDVWFLFPVQALEGEMRLVEGNGHSLAIALDSESRQPRKLELEGQADRKVALNLIEERRRVELTSIRIEADFADGSLSHVTAGGYVLVLEREWPSRRVTRYTGGLHAQAWLAPDGEIVRLEVTGDAEMLDGDNRLFADRLVGVPGRMEATGDPVVLLGDRGELKAPKITFVEETRLTHASGGVEAVLQQDGKNPLEGTPLAEGGEAGEPVRVVAQDAFWRESPNTFLFRGNVRAWSGERLVLAEELRGDLDDQLLSAAGNVETVFFTPATAERPSGQVRVTSGLLTYAANDRKLVYREQVVAVEGGRTLSCGEMEVVMAEDGEAESLLCTGAVRLEAPEHGRSVRAERAEYNLADEHVVFFGRPVVLLDRQGGEVTGRRVTYSTATGRVTVAGEEALRQGQSAPLVPQHSDAAGIEEGTASP